MRMLRLPARVAIALGAAAGLVLTLGLPWYARVPSALPDGGRAGDLTGPLAGLVQAAPRWIGASDGTIGWDLPGIWAMTLSGIAVLGAFAAVLCLAPATEEAGRRLLTLTSLAAAGVTLARILVWPGGTEPRYGLFVAAVAAVALVVTARGIAGCRRLRRVAPARAVR